MSADNPVAFEGGLSEALRARIELAGRDRDRCVQRGVQLILDSVPDYRLSADPHMVQDLSQACSANADLWYSALLERCPLVPENLRSVVDIGRRRVHQGVSLAGLLRAYRLFARAVWAQMIEAAADDRGLQAEMLAKLSPYLLQHFDVVAEALANIYIEEQSQHSRWRERLRQELWMIVLSRPDDVQGFRRHIEPLGLSPLAPYCAAVFQLRSDGNARPDLQIEPLSIALARRIGQPPDGLMRVVHRDHVVIWSPLPAGQSAVEYDGLLADAAASLISASSVAALAGIGLSGSGAHGWRSSMEQGFRALASGSARGTSPQVHRYSLIVLEEGALATENVAAFMRSMIDALAIDPTLGETLRVYLQHRQHRKSTAAALDVHPNTLDHRLGRIESLLGGSFADIDWLARVSTAMRIHRPGG